MKKKISILALLVAIATTAVAQTFVLPEAGKYYKIKGDHDNKPWLTSNLTSSSIVVSENVEDAGVFKMTTDGRLLEVLKNKYLGMNGNVISLVDNASANNIIIGGNANHNADGHTKVTDEGTKYSLKVAGNYLYNNSGDGKTHESSGWITTIERYWGFVEVSVPLEAAKTNALAHVEANAANLGAGIGYYSYVVDGVKTVDPEVVKDAIDAAETSEAVSAIVDSYAANLPEFGKAY